MPRTTRYRINSKEDCAGDSPEPSTRTRERKQQQPQADLSEPMRSAGRKPSSCSGRESRWRELVASRKRLRQREKRNRNAEPKR